MKTVVYQSFRTTRIPGWITACMASVRSWADASGFDYRFFDDTFLELAPAWYRERCAGEICPVTDLARLVMARELLRAGYERAVWADADMLVFAPELLRVEVPDGFGFCLEMWPKLDGAGQVQCGRTVNNSITIFTRRSVHLDFFIDACVRIAAGQPRVHKLAVGTHFLTGLARLMPLPVLPNVGIFSPMLMRDMMSTEQRHVASYGSRLPVRLAAANLCHSLAGQPVDGFVADEPVYEAAVESCLRSRGDIVNRHVRPTGNPS